MSSQNPNHPHPEGRAPQGLDQPPAYSSGQQGPWQDQPQQGYGRPQHGYGYPQGYAQPQTGPSGYHQQDLRHRGSQPGVPVGFGEAVKRFYAKYTQFSGRASRSEYWWVALYQGAIGLVLGVLMAAGSDAEGNLNGLGMLGAGVLALYVLSHMVPSIAIAVRRLHDAGLTGWLYLLSLIPYVGGLVIMVFMVLPPKPEGARFDR